MKIYNFLTKISFAIAMGFVLVACSDDEDTSQYYQANMRDMTVAEYLENGSNTQGSNYNTLYEAVVKAGLMASLEGGNITLMAPTDAAFEAAGIDVRDIDAADLAEILSYHVIGSAVESDALTGNIATLEGSVFTANGTCINGNTEVGTAGLDINLANGVVHSINNVLLPPTGDLVDKIAEMTSGANPELTLIQNAIVKAGLDATLASNSSFTVFAPSDAAMTAAGLDQAAIDAATAQELADIINYHVLAGYNFSCALESSRVATAAGALDMVPGVDIVVDGGDVSVNGADVESANILASNGVIHIVDAVIFPATTMLEALGPEVNISFGNDPITFDPMYDAVVRLGYDQTFLADLTAEYTVYGPCCGSFNEANYPTDEELKAVVDAHIFEGSVDIAAVAAEGGAMITSIGGDNYFVTTSDNGVFVNGSTFNAFGSTSGISFPVYNGLLVTTFPALNPLPAETTIELMSADVDYDLMAAALELLGLATSNSTVLALDNAQFTAEFGYSTVAEVEAADASEFDLLQNHVISGVYFDVDLDDGSLPELTAASSNALTFTYLNGGGIGIIIDISDMSTAVEVSGTDLFTGSNGVVHQVDGLIEL